jgi:hypothetical protein
MAIIEIDAATSLELRNRDARECLYIPGPSNSGGSRW